MLSLRAFDYDAAERILPRTSCERSPYLKGARPVPGPTMIRGVLGFGGRRKSGFWNMYTGTASPTCGCKRQA